MRALRALYAHPLLKGADVALDHISLRTLSVPCTYEKIETTTREVVQALSHCGSIAGRACQKILQGVSQGRYNTANNFWPNVIYLNGTYAASGSS